MLQPWWAPAVLRELTASSRGPSALLEERALDRLVANFAFGYMAAELHGLWPEASRRQARCALA
eukprot:1561134-Alexandrium_andersonii.AAC.1